MIYITGLRDTTVLTLLQIQADSACGPWQAIDSQIQERAISFQRTVLFKLICKDTTFSRPEQIFFHLQKYDIHAQLICVGLFFVQFVRYHIHLVERVTLAFLNIIPVDIFHLFLFWFTHKTHYLANRCSYSYGMSAPRISG